MYNSHAEPTLSIRLLCMVLFAAALLGLAPHATAQEDETGKQHFDQGVAAYNERDYHNALKHFGEAAQLEPSLAAEIHLYLGRIAIQGQTWRLAALEILRAKTMGLSEEREREATLPWPMS